MTDLPQPQRRGGRGADGLRPLEISPGATTYAEGSALIRLGETHVLCTASVDERVPRWLAGQGRGWVTAEYSMLPRATRQRTAREAVVGKQGGRTVEIQRLIGRSLRAAVDLAALGERQIVVDCDVLQADGGTRCASITGGYVALALAIHRLRSEKGVRRDPLRRAVAAVSVGVIGGVSLLDLDYAEDASADVDFNVVMTDAGAFVELQGTAERDPFDRSTLDDLLRFAGSGLAALFAAQEAAIRAAVTPPSPGRG
ncbi:MAG: Ribonuclease PH [uncultured Thermomicrobiales bacterium]|uniref:Ribonuclease PH n=1 Tax=uncultured Thermomicrobiales bacterium TaxID=1645740 RepID=A0A6J4UV81_9BACT|nr:MAG: Ribonuclease PH [uncultured Thermomicrobiales bacterium]